MALSPGVGCEAGREAESAIIQTTQAWTVSGMHREVPVPGVWAGAGGLGTLHNCLAHLSLESAFTFQEEARGTGN